MASAAISERIPEPEAGHATSAKGELARLLPLVLVVYSLLLPREIHVTLGEQTLYPSRAILLVLSLWLVHHIGSGRLAWRMADVFVLFGAVWMVVSFITAYGLSEGGIRGGALGFDVLAPYLVARACIRSATDMRRLLVMIAPGLFVAGASIVIESIVGHQIVRPLAAAMFNPLQIYEDGVAIAQYEYGNQFRLGLLRAAGPFSHPIVGGVLLASLIPLYLGSSLRGWPLLAGLAAAACAAFTVSSGPMLVAAICIGMLSFDAFQQRSTLLGWRTVIILGLLALAFIQVGSDNGAIRYLLRFTLEPGTGYFRLLIWEFGSRSVAEHPLFGIGFNDYERLPWMVPSVDAAWLLLAIRHGLPAVVPLFVGAIWAVGSLANMASVRSGTVDRPLFAGLAITLFALILAGFTVAYFGALQTWFWAMVGTGVALGTTTARQTDEFGRIPRA